MCAHLSHGDAVGKQADAFEHDALAGPQRARHGVGIHWLHADDPHRRHHRLHVRGDARQQPAAADGHEDGAQVARTLPHDLVADGPLPGNHQRIIERVDERRPGAIRFLAGERVSFSVRVSRELDVGAAAAHRIHLDVRRRPGHDDAGPHAEVLRGHRDALRVVAGARGDHAASPFVLREAGHAVVRTANLEAEDRLEVFSLEEHGDAEAGGKARREVERRLARDVVHAAGQDLANERIERHGGTITGIGNRDSVGSGHRDRGSRDRGSRSGHARSRDRRRRPVRPVRSCRPGRVDVRRIGERDLDAPGFASVRSSRAGRPVRPAGGRAVRPPS